MLMTMDLYTCQTFGGRPGQLMKESITINGSQVYTGSRCRNQTIWQKSECHPAVVVNLGYMF